MNVNTALKENGREGKRYRSLRTRLILSFATLFAFVFILIQLVEHCGLPFGAISGSRDRQRREVFKNLNLVADLKKERLERWIEEKCDDIHVTADTEYSSMMVSRILATYDRLVDSNLRGDGPRNQLQSDENYLQYVKYLNDIRTSYGFYKRFLVVDVRSGTVVLSTDDRLLGLKISRTELLSAVHGGNLSDVTDVGADEFGEGLVLRFAHVIRNAIGEVIAILLMDIDVNRVLPPMLHTGEGLGKTGEALLVNRDVRILAPLKNALSDGSVAEPLEYQIRAKPAILAAAGEEGIIESLDYRGEPVLAAYRHIAISPRVSWGMVVKRDRTELFATQHREMVFDLIVSLLGIVLLIGVSVAIAGKISRPLLSLGETADRVARGDLDARAEVESKDEIGILAETFNSMVQRIQNWSSELESAVAERTTLLNQTNDDLKQEIARRKRSEEKLKLSQFTIDHSSESMFWIGKDGRILQVNDYACEKLGFSREELAGMAIHDIDPDFPKEMWNDRWNELKRSGSILFESVHRRKDGLRYPVEVSANHLEYEGKEYNFTFARDISERKRIEQMKEEFISTVSHELRTPLTSIHGSIGLINSGKIGKLSPQVEKLLEIAERNSVRLKKLIDDILDIQKIESGKLKFDLRRLELKPLLEVSVEDIKSFGDQFNVEFVLGDIEPDMIVRADGDRLKQVMNNLLSNAAKFSPANSSVEIFTKHRNGSIRVEVRDNGPGIPVDFRDKIFDRFTQEDSTMTRERGGSGLGLHITRSIIEMHGGEIGFETELDVGTTFYFELPEYGESAKPPKSVDLST